MIYLDTTLLYIREFVACIGVAVIAGGALYSIYQLFLLTFYKAVSLDAIRLRFGMHVILGLEFMVGADIIGSLVQPDYYNLGMLLILVVIRTILSYFLSYELSAIALQK